MTRLEVVREIIADCEADVAKHEGKPMTGREVAEYFGETLAMLQTLARVVESILVEGIAAPTLDYTRELCPANCDCGECYHNPERNCHCFSG